MRTQKTTRSTSPSPIRIHSSIFLSSPRVILPPGAFVVTSSSGSMASGFCCLQLVCRILCHMKKSCRIVGIQHAAEKSVALSMVIPLDGTVTTKVLVDAPVRIGPWRLSHMTLTQRSARPVLLGIDNTAAASAAMIMLLPPSLQANSVSMRKKATTRLNRPTRSLIGVNRSGLSCSPARLRSM